jgi:hypothetical protein
MKFLRHISVPFVISLLIVLCGCNFTSSFTNRDADKKDAEKVTDKFFEYSKKNDTVAIYKLFSKKFFEAASKGKLSTILNGSQKRLGDMVSDSLIDWQTKVITGTENSAEYRFLYKIHRSKYDSKEEFDMTKDEDGKIRIDYYNVESDGFFK